MKNFKHNIIATALLVFSVLSCDKAESPVSIPEQTMTMSYSISLDDMTKAGEETPVNYIWCGAYKVVDGVISDVPSSQSLTKFNGSSVECSVDMVQNQSYKVVFIAQHYIETATELLPVYAFDTNRATISFPSGFIQNSDKFDLFGYVDSVTDFRPVTSKNIILTRKVAKINFVTTDEDRAAAASDGVSPTKFEVELNNVSTSMSMLDSTPSSGGNVRSTTSLGSFDNNNLATVYTFVPQNGTDIDVSITIYKGENPFKKITSVSVPCKVNFKTNVTVKLR